jgi:hypothetical protein
MAVNDDSKALDSLYREAWDSKWRYGLKDVLAFVRRLPEVGPYNAALLQVQRPGTVHVATLGEWRRRFGRDVKPRANPLVILRPFGPVEFVFDISDTVGPPVPDEVMRPFATHSDVTSEGVRRFAARLPQAGVGYSEAERGAAAAGSLQETATPRQELAGGRPFPVHYDLVVNQDLDAGAKFATIAHELGHLFCGHLGAPDGAKHPARPGLDEATGEFEAESVSWLICGRVGIETPSGQYLGGYLDGDGAPPPDVSLEAIFKAVRLIEEIGGGAIALGRLLRAPESLL